LPFELPERPEPDTEPLIKPITHPIWTANKAKLIERYLYYFVLITKHGTYIDGFAGPQQPDKPEMWAAKLVLENQPRWLRHLHLFEKNKKRFRDLEELSAVQPAKTRKEPKRQISLYPGDFNLNIHQLLDSATITEKEATFALLDQRTFECHWSTVEALSTYKKSGTKIELFYFLPNSWLPRAVSGIKNTKILTDWWGRADWDQLVGMTADQRRDKFVERFKKELGYKSVKAWPIFQSSHGGNIMYYMIHATDHPEAPKQMRRAYQRAVLPKEPAEQLQLGYEAAGLANENG
jgi:three-Cys-motif partner protein